MKRWIVVAMLLAICLPGAVVAAEESEAAPGTLELSENAGVLEGKYTHEDLHVSFEAGESTVRLVINSRLTVDVSLEEGSLVLKTGGGLLVETDDRQVANALHRKLQEQWGRASKPFSREHLLKTAATLVGTAQVGASLDFIKPLQAMPPTQREETFPSDPPRDPNCTDVTDEDGVLYYSNLVCKGVIYRVATYHDACPEHGFDRFLINSGCKAPSCKGRCGAGCGFAPKGAGSYTHDCGDHDKCCENHGGCTNPFDIYCGDEYFNAIDDVFVDETLPQCWWCGSPPDREPPPCQGPRRSDTWRIGGGIVAPAKHQLSFMLSRREERPEGSFHQEEWAVIGTGSNPTVVASTPQYRVAVLLTTRSLRLPASGDTEVLVVEEPTHSMRNPRWAPLPQVEPVTATAFTDWKGGSWFRAEVAESGDVDRLAFLGSAPPSAVGEALRTSISLTWDDDRRHRIIIFGRVEVEDGVATFDPGDGRIIHGGCCCEPWDDDWFCRGDCPVPPCPE